MQTLNFTLFTDRHGLGEELFKFLKLLEIKLGDGVWLAGGAIRRTIQGAKLDSDFDFFFQSEEKFQEFLNLILKGGRVELLEHTKTEHNEQLKVKSIVNNQEYILQLIKIDYYPTLADCLETFDYTICQFGLDGETLYAGDFSLWDLGRKRLAVNQITFPVASLRRLLKYSKQGFYACTGCLQTILQSAVNNPDALNSKVKYID